MTGKHVTFGLNEEISLKLDNHVNGIIQTAKREFFVATDSSLLRFDRRGNEIATHPYTFSCIDYNNTYDYLAGVSDDLLYVLRVPLMRPILSKFPLNQTNVKRIICFDDSNSVITIGDEGFSLWSLQFGVINLLTGSVIKGFNARRNLFYADQSCYDAKGLKVNQDIPEFAESGLYEDLNENIIWFSEPAVLINQTTGTRIAFETNVYRLRSGTIGVLRNGLMHVYHICFRWNVYMIRNDIERLYSSADNSILHVELSNGTQSVFAFGTKSQICSFKPTTRDRRVVFDSGSAVTSCVKQSDGKLRILTVRTQRSPRFIICEDVDVAIMTLTPEGLKEVHRMRLRPNIAASCYCNGKWLYAVVSQTNVLSLIDAQTFKISASCEIHSHPILAIYSHSKSMAIILQADNEFLLYCMNLGAVVSRCIGQYRKNSCLFGNFLYTGLEDGSVNKTIISHKRIREYRHLRVGNGPIISFAFTSVGYVCSLCDRLVVIDYTDIILRHILIPVEIRSSVVINSSFLIATNAAVLEIKMNNLMKNHIPHFDGPTKEMRTIDRPEKHSDESSVDVTEELNPVVPIRRTLDVHKIDQRRANTPTSGINNGHEVQVTKEIHLPPPRIANVSKTPSVTTRRNYHFNTLPCIERNIGNGDDYDSDSDDDFCGLRNILITKRRLAVGSLMPIIMTPTTNHSTRSTKTSRK